MLVTNEKAAGAGGFNWSPGDIVDIPHKLAAEILAIKDAGFKAVAEVEAEAEHLLHPSAAAADASPVGDVSTSDTDPQASTGADDATPSGDTVTDVLTEAPTHD